MTMTISDLGSKIDDGGDLLLFEEFPVESVKTFTSEGAPTNQDVGSTPVHEVTFEVEDRMTRLFADFPRPVEGVFLRDVILDVEVLVDHPETTLADLEDGIIIDAASFAVERQIDVLNAEIEEFDGLFKALGSCGLLNDVNSLAKAWQETTHAAMSLF